MATTPTIEPPKAVLWTLRIIVALQCVGAAWAVGLEMSPVAETLFFDVGVSEAAALWFDRVVLILLVAAAAAVLGLRTRLVPAGVAAWFVLLALAHWYRGGAPFSEWSLAAHAVRYAAPAALAMLLPPPAPSEARIQRDRIAHWLLRGAVALTFAMHGVEALSQHPRFVDYLLVAWEKFFGLRLAEPSARSLLVAIGVVDLLVAAGALLLSRFPRLWRSTLAWMAFWGAITAASRIVYGGPEHGHMTLVRAANAGVPLALFWWFERRD